MKLSAGGAEIDSDCQRNVIGHDDGVVASERVDLQAVDGLAAGDVRLGLETANIDPAVAGVDVHVVGALGAVYVDDVGLAVAGGEHGEVEVDVAHVGAAHVVDRDGVGATERCHRQTLDVFQVHADVAEVAQEDRTTVDRREAHPFVPASAHEDKRVAAGLAVDEVTALAGQPLEGRLPDDHASDLYDALGLIDL